MKRDLNTRHAPSVPVSFSQGNNESAKMPMLRCAIVATSVIVSVQVDPETRNDQVVRLIQLKTNNDGPPHALELFVATPVGHTTIGLPTYHPDYKLLDRGHIQTMKRYLTSDSRLSLTSTVGETFATAKPGAIHLLLKLPDDGASPSIAESCDTLPKERQLCSLLLGGYLWLETPYRDDQLVSELIDELKRNLVELQHGYTPPAVLNFAGSIQHWIHPALTVGHYVADAPIEVSIPVLVRFPDIQRSRSQVIGERRVETPSQMKSPSRHMLADTSRVFRDLKNSLVTSLPTEDAKKKHI